MGASCCTASPRPSSGPQATCACCSTRTPPKQAIVLREIGRRDLLRFRSASTACLYRPVRAGDGATAVVTVDDLAHLVDGGAIAKCLLEARDGGAGVSLIAVGSRAAIARIDDSTAARQVAAHVVAIEVPDERFLLDPLVRVAAKMVLNALSTCMMVRMGRVLGNRMIWVVPSNLKLIDRSIRYIRNLAGVSYEQACDTLFDVIEYIEPRRTAGQAYPSPVGVATMRLRHGLDMSAAEARLYKSWGEQLEAPGARSRRHSPRARRASLCACACRLPGARSVHRAPYPVSQSSRVNHGSHPLRGDADRCRRGNRDVSAARRVGRWRPADAAAQHA